MLTAIGNLKWEGSFETLQNFINAKRISTATKWSTRGAAKLCETSELAIRWYSETNTLTLKGERSVEVKEKLISIMQNRNKIRANLHPPENGENLHMIDPVNNPLGENRECFS